MPYYHTKDGGEISLWARRCCICGHNWPLVALFKYPPPRDMKFLPSKPIQVQDKGKTSYSKWADKVPGASQFASRLPNWPRWARLLSVLIILGLVFGGIVWLIDR